jgi:uncharacterized repeat protein (TIGR01451 family)
MALKYDGTVWVWGGYTWVYPLGSATPVQVAGLSGIVGIAAGGNHALAVDRDGTVWTWGLNYYGELGDGTTDWRQAPVRVSGLSGIVSIAAGGEHSLAVSDDGTVWAWGRNERGQLGDGTTADRSVPVRVTGLSGITAVAAGDAHNLAMDADGTLHAWGDNRFRQLGDGGVAQQLIPSPVTGLDGVVAAAGGGAHSLALKGDETVWAWGRNQDGQLGDGTATDRWTPAPVGGLSGVAAVAAGERHSLALKEDGTVWAWGSNDLGQLGDGTTTSRSRAAPVSGLRGMVAIAAAGSQSMALARDGTVWEWGLNIESCYCCPADYRLTPAQASGLSGVAAIEAGGTRGLALKDNGTVSAWGAGPICMGGLDSSLDGITAIASGRGYSLGLKRDGTVWLSDGGPWIGDPSLLINYLPWSSKWSGFDSVVALAVGSTLVDPDFLIYSGQTLALKSDGTVWASGSNVNGELGEGTCTYGRLTVAPVGGLSDVVSIAAGEGTSLAVKRDGSVWAWGSNSQGQLGNEPTGSVLSSIPVPVIPLGSPDLGITITHTGDFSVGDQDVYNLTIANSGLMPTAGTVTLIDILPAGLDYISAAGPGWTCSASGQRVICTNPGPISPGVPSTLDISVRVGSAAIPGVTNLATVTNASDRNLSNNTAGDVTVVVLQTPL